MSHSATWRLLFASRSRRTSRRRVPACAFPFLFLFFASKLQFRCAMVQPILMSKMTTPTMHASLIAKRVRPQADVSSSSKIFSQLPAQRQCRVLRGLSLSLSASVGPVSSALCELVVSERRRLSGKSDLFSDLMFLFFLSFNIFYFISCSTYTYICTPSHFAKRPPASSAKMSNTLTPLEPRRPLLTPSTLQDEPLSGSSSRQLHKDTSRLALWSAAA